jgi:hypothetical protein
VRSFPHDEVGRSGSRAETSVADEIIVLVDGWSQNYAAWFMQIPQSRVSDLRRGRLETMSLERLLQCLSRLSRTIEITTTRASGGRSFNHDKVDNR